MNAITKLIRTIAVAALLMPALKTWALPFWEPPQQITFPNIGFVTPLGSYDPSVVIYMLEHDVRFESGQQGVGYRGSDTSYFGFNINVVGHAPGDIIDRHRIYFFGPNFNWGITLASSFMGEISDPRTVPYDVFHPIPWNPGVSAGVTIAAPLSPSLWDTAAVPDAGTTALLMTLASAGLGLWRRRRS